MESSQLKRICMKMREMHNTMAMVLPLESLGVHPFDHFFYDTEQIVSCIDMVIERIGSISDAVQNEVERDVVSFKRLAMDLELSELVVPSFCNLFMIKEYIKNEIDMAFVVKSRVQAQILAVVEDIKAILDELGCVNRISDGGCGDHLYLSEASNGIVSVKKLSKFLKYRGELRAEKQLREKNRYLLYEETRVFLSKLSREDEDVRMDQKIFVLESLNRRYKIEVESKEEEFLSLKKEIRKLEGYLDVSEEEIKFCLSDESMLSMKRYSSYLLNERRRRLDEMYDKNIRTLCSLLDLFGIEHKKYERNEEDVGEMKKLIEIMEIRKNMFFEITSLGDKRKKLVERIREFEKMASDPRRLFKPSFQLMNEEKFRNGMYPNLIKIDDVLFKLLDGYELKFGPFKKDGTNYREILKSETENKMVSKAMFNNKPNLFTRKR